MLQGTIFKLLAIPAFSLQVHTFNCSQIEQIRNQQNTKYIQRSKFKYYSMQSMSIRSAAKLCKQNEQPLKITYTTLGINNIHKNVNKKYSYIYKL